MPLSTFLKAIGLALLVCIQTTHAAPHPERDWQKYPAVVQVDTQQEIYAIGDAHADPARLVGALLAAKLIAAAPDTNNPVQWRAGKAVLVITGDMIDKWNNSLGVITLLQALKASAAAQGGQVWVTMGNHEAEFLADPTGKKTSEFSNELKAVGLNPLDVANCIGDIGQFLCQLPIAIRVNDWFFSHGGNSGGRSIAQLEAAIQAGFAKDGFATTELIGNNSILEARLNKKGPNGLPWFYDGSKDTNPKKLLAQYAAKLGVKHLVQGHQYGKVKFQDGVERAEEDFFQRYGLLFLIDSGMSQGIEDSTSTGGALHITGIDKNQKAIILCANGKQETLWSSKKAQDSKGQHCGK